MNRSKVAFLKREKKQETSKSRLGQLVKEIRICLAAN